AQTTDQQHIKLEVNITSANEIEPALKYGAEGVGLFRTEVLYMDRHSLPSEEEQYLVYRNIVSKLGGRSLVIRTLDIGADKRVDYIPLPEEDNPVVGYRGIRISLDRKDLFESQLRAIL